MWAAIFEDEVSKVILGTYPDAPAMEGTTMNRPEILDAAKACVCGRREEDYGAPEDNFRLIADLWAAYLRKRCVAPGADVDISPADVAMMMALLKIARIATGSGTADSFVDLAGYAACGGEIATRGKTDG